MSELYSPLVPLPYLTAELPGIGGRIKQEPEDFEVEEIPAYQPSGSGEFLYLWLEKRDMGADYFNRQIARRLDLPLSEIGTAGLKDRRAVTRQMVSVPLAAEPRLASLEGDGIKVLSVGRHTNKLRAGHLHGNKFRILVREVHAETQGRLAPLVQRLEALGFPNFYGPQRFGRAGETWQLGRDLLAGRAGRQARQPFLRKLALSAAQAGLFNRYLVERLCAGFLHKVLLGDVLAKWPIGGMFVAQDVPVEQARFDAREVVSAGPIFGTKTFASQGPAAERESQLLQNEGLSPDSFTGFGKLVQGTRRHNLVYPKDLSAQCEPEGVRFTFTLPTGSYATVLLREFTKSELTPEDDC